MLQRPKHVHSANETHLFHLQSLFDFNLVYDGYFSQDATVVHMYMYIDVQYTPSDAASLYFCANAPQQGIPMHVCTCNF